MAVLRNISIILLLIIITRAPAVQLKTQSAGQTQGSQSQKKSPLDIQFYGVRPDNSDDILDAKGKKIDSSVFSIYSSNTWSANNLRRDFIFKLPETDDLFPFVFNISVILPGEHRLLRRISPMPIYPERISVQNCFVLSTEIPQTYSKSFFGLFNRKRYVDLVDVSFQYYYGPPGPAVFSFSGPFETDKTFSADGKKDYQMVVSELNEITNRGFPSSSFRLICPEMFSSVFSIFFIDTSGRRHRAGVKRFSSNSDGTTIEFDNRSSPLILSDIQAIVAEEPSEYTVRDVLVAYRDRPPQGYAPYLDVMAEKLGLTHMTQEQLANYQFNDAAEAIEVIDIIRGRQHAQRALESIMHRAPKINIPELDEKKQDKIHRAAIEWSEVQNLAAYGIRLGLMGRWPEFFDLTIERLGENPPQNQIYPYAELSWRQDNRNIAGTMVNYRLDGLTPGRVEKIKQLILETEDGPVSTQLFYYLDWTKSQETTDALWELAQNEKPWIWWPAVKAWYRRVANNKRSLEELPDNIKRRLTLVQNNMYEDTLDDESKELLKEIFTPEFAKFSYTLWYEACRRISGQFDRKTATEIYINYLRRMQSGTTSRQWITDDSGPIYSTINIIRTLNIWYDMNIGDLGIEETRDSGNREPRTIVEFQNLLTKTIQWYENNSDVEPLKPVFAGKVADTAGNPVAGAKLSLTGLEYYQNDRGRRSRREVELAKRLSEDDGSFSFDEVTNDEHYLLDVTADGFLVKERLHIQSLPDGRYRYNEYNYPEDNVITMQRPGKISGTVIGADGQPLANTALALFANIHYSDHDPQKTVTTDSDGKFAKDGIAAGPALLSYIKYRRIQQERGSRREYGGLCGSLILENKEGQELSDIVLDLSRSVCSLELQVADASGEPVNEISINFSIEMPKGCGYRYGDIFHTREVNSEGLYRFDGLPPGKWHLYISNRQYNHKDIDIELSPSKTARYKMQFDAASVRARFRMEQEAATEKQPQQSQNETSAGQAEGQKK